MKREELVRSREYWLAEIQLNLFNLIETYREKNNLKKKDLAEYLGVTKGYITQILNGDFDHKISKLVDLALAFNKVPVITYKDLDEFIEEDSVGKSYLMNHHLRPIQYTVFINIDSQETAIGVENDFMVPSEKLFTKYSEKNVFGTTLSTR